MNCDASITIGKGSKELSPSCVHVYAWRLEESLPDERAHLALLSADEIARADRFRFSRHRAGYLLAHANLRRILGGYCKWPPGDLAFSSGQFGKPCLFHPRSEITFNLSHTSGFCAVAIAISQPVGLDVERIRPIEESVASSHFSTAELSSLSSLQGEEWLRGFYRCWTSKEAILKAEGVGLHVPLDSFDVQVLPNEQAQLLAARDAACFHYSWQLHTLELDPLVESTLATTDGASVSVFSL